MKNDVHLRHIVSMGVQIETQGSIFYENLAEKARDPKVKEFYRKFAQDELRHKDVFVKMLENWDPLPITQESLDIFEREFKHKGIFDDPPSQYATEEEAAKYAIGEEKKMVEFYRSFEKSFSSSWKLANLMKLIVEELGHVNDLANQYPSLKSYAMM